MDRCKQGKWIAHAWETISEDSTHQHYLIEQEKRKAQEKKDRENAYEELRRKEKDQASKSSGGANGREWKHHKWITRKRNENGKWIYTYHDDSTKQEISIDDAAFEKLIQELGGDSEIMNVYIKDI